MGISTGDLIDFVGYFAHIDRSMFIREGAQTKLAILTSAASEEAAYVIDKRRVLRAAVDLSDVGPVVALKVDEPWTEDDSHSPRASSSAAALTVVVASPGVDFTVSALDEGVHISALH